MTVQHDVKNVELDEMSEDNSIGRPLFNNNIELVKNVKVELSVRLGESELTVDELFNLRAGSVVKLNKSTNSTVDIELEGKVVARGTIVAVDDNYGIKITEISQPQ